MAQPVDFGITPEKQASQLEYYRRQFFETCPATTRADADLSGKVAILTGGNGGIGVECARQLLALGLSKLILAVRDTSKGEAAFEQIAVGQKIAREQIEIWQLDMSSYESIRAFSERANSLERLDIIILNAGIYRVKMEFNTSTGHEEDLQTNYLSTALLILLFIRNFKTRVEKSSEATPGRIVVVSSDTAGWAKFPQRNADPLFPALDNKTRHWDAAEQYGVSKLLGHLFISELVKIVPSSTAVINMVNPGFCYGSGLARDVSGSLLGAVFFIWSRTVGHSSAVGARALVDAAVKKGQESHGNYVESGKLRPSAPLVYTAEGGQVARRLWTETMHELSFAGVDDILRAF